MKTFITAIFAAGVSLTTLSSAQAITAAPLTEAAKEASSVVEVQVEREGTGGAASAATGTPGTDAAK